MNERPTRRQRVLARAKTDWRLALVIVVLSAASALAVYFAPSNDTRRLKKDVISRGTPCIQVHETRADPDGEPSEGCYRLLRLFIRACDNKPVLCGQAARRIVTNGRPELLDLGVLRAVRTLGERATGGEGPPGAGAPTTPGGSAPGGSLPGPPTGRVPPQGPGAPGSPPGGGDGQQPPAAPPQQPSPLEGVRNLGNDLIESLGGGRPLPPPPNVPDLLPPGLLGRLTDR